MMKTTQTDGHDGQVKRLCWVLNTLIEQLEGSAPEKALGCMEEHEDEAAELIKSTGLADEAEIRAEFRPVFKRTLLGWEEFGIGSTPHEKHPTYVSYQFVESSGMFHSRKFSALTAIGLALPEFDPPPKGWKKVTPPPGSWAEKLQQQLASCRRKPPLPDPDVSFVQTLVMCLKGWLRRAQWKATGGVKDRRRQGDHGRGYLREAPKLSEATIADHMITLRYLAEHFGDGKAIDKITLADASAFVDSLAAGKLAGARKKSKRDYGMSGQTIRGHIRNAKAIFNWGLLFGMVQDNPFSKFDGKPLVTEPNHYVTLSEFRRLYRAAPDRSCALFFALCRLAGLRRDAARTLPWSGHATDSGGERHWVGIDWQRRRICIVGNHKTKRLYRELPIRPLLYRLLLRAFDAAEAGTVTITSISPNNLTRIGQKAARDAGMTPWPKLYQAMRSSCENDHKLRGVAEATYAAWMGHSPTVSRKHYTAPTDAEYAAVAKVA